MRVTGTCAGALLLCLALAAPLRGEPVLAPEEAAAILAAYGDHMARIDGSDLVWKDGTRMALDDGRAEKSFEELLDAPDIADQFVWPYPLGNAGFPPGFRIDPGRVRNEPFFDRMYGDCRKDEVAARLVEVPWLPGNGGGSVRFTSVNGADRALAAASAELDLLPKRFMAYLIPSAGTYNCRVIAGTTRRSVHAYGAAIDISLKHTHYWRWTKPGADGRLAYRNAIPIEIVEIFERHGFIWGGKWYHYDTMHFEYRPELIALARNRQGKSAP